MAPSRLRIQHLAKGENPQDSGADMTVYERRGLTSQRTVLALTLYFGLVAATVFAKDCTEVGDADEKRPDLIRRLQENS